MRRKLPAFIFTLLPGVSTPRWSEEELEKYTEKTYTFKGSDGTERTVSAYAASQILRRLERRIRAIKTALAVEEAKGGLARPDTVAKLKRDRGSANKKIEDFCKETGLKRQYVRERVARR